ncbi:MAG: hypothetical protein EP335_11865 [Alphaproteobacteria bacterium]|nr:MAG: hypothetical protein EP335_11865 [Alphaproteobacteria bacterium]
MGKILKSTISDPTLFISPEMKEDIDTINHPKRRYRWINQPIWDYSTHFKKNMRSPTFLSDRDKTNRRKLIEALVAPSSSDALKGLGYKILQCGPSNQCHSPLCNYCRTKMQNKYEERALKYFGTSDHGDLHFLTILDDVTYTPLEVMRDCQERLNSRLRNRLRCSLYKKAISVFGAFEIDIKKPLLETQCQEQAELLSQYGMSEISGPAFMPHMHLIVDLKGMDSNAFRAHLRERFSKPKQITLSPFRQKNTIAENLRTTARYCFKFRYQFADNILRARPAYGKRYDDDLLRLYAVLIQQLKSENGVISFEFRHNLIF